MRGESSVKAQLHHQRLGVGELLLLTSIEGLRDEQVLAKDPLDDLKVLVRIIRLTEGLLSRHFTWASIQTVGTCRSYLARISSVGIH